MEKEYWILNRLRRKRGQTWTVFAAEFKPYGVSYATVWNAAHGARSYELTQDKLDRYLADHKDELVGLE